jgi:hypothetical protein
VQLRQLRIQEEVHRNLTLPLSIPAVLPYLRREKVDQRMSLLCLVPQLRRQKEDQEKSLFLLISPVVTPQVWRE